MLLFINTFCPVTLIGAYDLERLLEKFTDVKFRDIENEMGPEELVV